MYLLEGKYQTSVIAPYIPEGYSGGHKWAGSFKLMHKLVSEGDKVVLRPCGFLATPETYTIHMARYDYYSNKDKVKSPSLAYLANYILANAKPITL